MCRKAPQGCHYSKSQQQLNTATFWRLLTSVLCKKMFLVFFYSSMHFFFENPDRWSIDFYVILLSLNEICLLMRRRVGQLLFHQRIANKTQKMHENEGRCLKLIAVDTFMRCTESLSLSALIMWTNQCLLGWKRRARLRWRRMMKEHIY